MDKQKPEKRSYFDSGDAKTILSICGVCQRKQKLGMIIGKSGYGKTYALKYYRVLQHVRYIECTDAMSNGDLIDAIETALYTGTGLGTIYRRMNRLREFFSENKGYLLIIDEADKLVSKATQKKLESLRYLYDGGNVGIVLAGEPALEERVKKYLDRVANRIDYRFEMTGLKRSEVQRYLSAYNITADAQEELILLATSRQGGCFRLLDRTLRNALDIARDGNGQVTLDVIRKARAIMV